MSATSGAPSSSTSGGETRQKITACAETKTMIPKMGPDWRRWSMKIGSTGASRARPIATHTISTLARMKNAPLSTTQSARLA